VSVLPADGPRCPGPAADAQELVPHWLSADARAELATVVRTALTSGHLLPAVAGHLQEVLTELYVAAAREIVWPGPAARVRAATGWADDVLPVRLSALELASLLAVPELPARLRGALLGAGW
jgi:hypothetical protein